MTPDWLDDLRATLPDEALREVGDAYLAEPRGTWRGSAGAVVAPRNAEEVSQVVRFAAARGIPIVPWGGGTGLVGGQTMPDAAPILLTTERMRAIRAVHPAENVLIVEAGCILADVQSAAAQADRLFPLALASEGTARIGGLLSTNAGGVNVLRYGNARDLCLGIEAVMPSGEVFRGLRRLRKDNTGYDLKGLLIGAEGTLGIITAAALRLFPRPVSSGTSMMVVPGPEAALDLLSMAQASGGVSAFELISGQGLRFLAETDLPVRPPFDEVPEWSVLIDLGLGPGGDPQKQLETLFAEAFDIGLVSDGVIAQSEQQRHDLWAVRETIPEANKRVGAIVSNDISLPLSAVPDFIEGCTIRLRREEDLRILSLIHI